MGLGTEQAAIPFTTMAMRAMVGTMLTMAGTAATPPTMVGTALITAAMSVTTVMVGHQRSLYQTTQVVAIEQTPLACPHNGTHTAVAKAAAGVVVE